VLFLLIYAYWRRLGLSPYLVIFGMMLFVWSIAFSNYGSDLSYNTYFDLIFYVLTVLLMLHGRYIWVMSVVVIAALNRETSVFLPAVVLAGALLTPDSRERRSRIVMAVVSLLIFAALTVIIRIIVGPTHYSPGNTPLQLLISNLTGDRGYFLLFMTFGVIPIFALWGWKNWPRPLQLLFWLVALPWVLAHFVLAAAVETRLFLVPHVLVLIPAFLFAFAAAMREQPQTTTAL
jgi:hypothetical protein